MRKKSWNQFKKTMAASTLAGAITFTGCAVMPSVTAFADTTEVDFHTVSVKEIEFYVDKYKPYDKAGAYAIQEWIGVVGIKSINGDFYNVMGLPVSRVVRELKKLIG